ncbi:unnamed protein product [Rotaria sp. Silwood1]|nr:unnamed protein product [Rotaria sp. Silwood1]
MHFTILFVLAILKICVSSVLFRIHSNNENVFINSSYLFGTIHSPHHLVWSYLSNDSLQIFAESEEIWMEQDFTDSPIIKYLYGCKIDSMTRKQQAHLRTKTWSQFLNETKRKPNNKSKKSNNLAQWRKWFINKQLILNKYFWRNETISNDTIVDHRIILEAYQRGIYVGSLESIPNDCSLINKLQSSKKSSKYLELSNTILASRLYNCDMINDDVVNKAFETLKFFKTKKRNQQITKKIRKLLKKDSHKKYVFAIGAGYLVLQFLV